MPYLRLSSAKAFGYLIAQKCTMCGLALCKNFKHASAPHKVCRTQASEACSLVLQVLQLAVYRPANHSAI